MCRIENHPGSPSSNRFRSHCKNWVRGADGSEERCDRPTRGRRVFCDDCAEVLALTFPMRALEEI